MFWKGADAGVIRDRDTLVGSDLNNPYRADTSVVST